jgi:excisionase family DNA binding protein
MTQPLRNVSHDAPTEPPKLDRDVWLDGALTVTGAASLMATSRKTVFVMMKEGRLPWGRFGSHRRIPRRAVIDVLAGRSDPGDSKS